MYYTYLHCKPNGDPFYVGKGSGRRAIRVKQKSRNKFHQDIVKHYGASNILIYTFECESEDQALADEIQQIAQLRREGYKLANFNDGGEGNRNMPLESRKRIGDANRGNKYVLGFRHSEESRKRMSEAAKKRFQNPEFKQNILKHLDVNRVGNKSRSGQKQNVEEIEKRKLTLLGNQRCLGHKIPDGVKMKISESMKKARADKPWSTKRKVTA